MPKVTENKDILNAIRNEQSSEYQERIPKATGNNDIEILQALENYPTEKNNFINTLTNKIGKTMFFNKVFNNPLKLLHKGMLPYGKNIEQMFVELAESKGIDEHFTGSTSEEGDLIKATKPKVKVDFIKQNYEYKFKTSISNAKLRGAFHNSNGLQTLLTSIVDSLYSSVEVKEFRDMKKILINSTKDATGGSTIDIGLIGKIYADANTKANAIIPIGQSLEAKTLTKKIRATTSRLGFPSTKYNLAGVETWSNSSDLILYTLPEIEAELDVEVLAHAFNISNADIKTRTIILDELGLTKVGGNEVVAILADKDCIQAWDTVNETNNFVNPEQLTTNYFAHKHGIMAGCSFANAILFVKGDTVL